MPTACTPLSARARFTHAWLAAVILTILLTLVSAGNGRTTPSGDAGPPRGALLVQAFGGNFSLENRELDVTVDLTGEKLPPGRIAIDVPPRFPLEPDRPAGSPVGQAYLFARTAGGRLTEYAGPIGAEPLDGPASAAAQACNARPHTGVWLARLRRGTHEVDLPLYLAAAPSGAAELGIDLCPPPGSGLTIAAVVVSLAGIDLPKTPGTYTWRAFVVPEAAGGQPRPAGEYELRSLVVVPHVLILRGAYDPVTRLARLTGSLRLSGRPQRRATVLITRLDRTITPHGPSFHDAPEAVLQTTLSGTFAVTVPLSSTKGFVAGTPATAGRCGSRGPTPAGCEGQTRAGVASEPITLGVP